MQFEQAHHFESGHDLLLALLALSRNLRLCFEQAATEKSGASEHDTQHTWAPCLVK
jgi:hypothetical protein